MLQISILETSRIPKIKKFRGDNYADFKIWISLKTKNDKRLDILFCCLEGTAFSPLRTANANITYAQVKD